MKVLVVSHNVFSHDSNMGITLQTYFKSWPTGEIAQFYIHSEVPTAPLCKNYYRVTDKEILKSILTRKSGAVFKENDIRTDLTCSRTDTGYTAVLYQKARKRTPLVYLARNAWWALGAWKTKKLLRWVDEFSPDVIFLASGDYSFIYKIALFLAKRKNIPLVVSCMDDYYFNNKNEKRFLGKFTHRLFMKQVHKTMDYASCIFSICDKMRTDYGEYFHKPCYTLHTAASISAPLQAENAKAISYIGNLGLKRNEQLIKLGRELKQLGCPNNPGYIDVYSAENRPEILADLTEENGIRFHGRISADQVLDIMRKSMAIIHTESFDEITRKSVTYSISTKIPDSLASGACILAYGPPEIASIDYLKKTGAAFCITDDCDLPSALQKLITDEPMRNEIVHRAIALAQKNHDPESSCRLIRNVLSEVCEN